MNAKKRAAIALALVAGLMTAPAAAFAKNGADDPAGHNQGDDHGRTGRTTLVHNRKGNDDPTGHDQGDDHGKDRKGNDDPPGHDQGDDHGGR